MVSMGTKMKIKVDRILDNPRIRSTATLTPKTKVIGSYGGYVKPTETDGTPTTIYVIPSNYVATNFLILMAGNFDSGSIKLITKGDTTITKDYSITWQSKAYDIEEIRPIMLNDVKVALVISLSENTA